MYRLNKLFRKIDFIGESIRHRRLNWARFVNDTYAFSLLESLQHCDPENFSVVIDGGANRGQFSKALLNLNPNLRVIAVEPLFSDRPEGGNAAHDPGDCSQSLNSLRSTYPAFQVISAALTDKVGRSNFLVTRFDECSSLIDPPKNSRSGAFDVTKVLQVNTTTIDTIVEEQSITNLDLLKLDLQGGEMLALRGAIKSLEITEYIFVELNLRRIYQDAPTINEITEFLHLKGFLFKSIVNTIKTADGSISQCDGLFKKQRELYC